MKYPNQVEFSLSGKMALFSDPLTRAGGEKCSYQIPTYQALKGILESCYWKPTFIWYIDQVRVMNQIKSRSEGIRPINYAGGNTLSIYTYLTDVVYQVRAHFEWNEHRPDLVNDRNEHKHFLIAKRMIERGGRRDVFLGTRECQGYVEPCTFGEGDSFYEPLEQMPFGLMFHGFNYPDETGRNQLEARFWYPKMEHGIVTFCTPQECPAVRVIHEQKPKEFLEGENFSGCDVLEKEVFPNGLDAKTI